ncbi:SpvB/TcaC N-terminal domain-containing protein [Streptomyces sp. MN03-5084-2B]|nr:SpvB/TcaC N-terminal domain-containing protein [Streptomyces sp. MN03-5084-2B]
MAESIGTVGSVYQPIGLPSGGGSVAGIGETFRPSPFTGTGNVTIPLPGLPARGGAGPGLALQYSTGHGNGPFGLGWQLNLPRIARKTARGVPTYDDGDVFVLDSADDLVPVGDPVERAGATVRGYRPRVETLFARIERWTGPDGATHWRVTSTENITSVYGATDASRLTDPNRPDDPHRVFAWLLSETVDALGNRVRYEYVQEDPALRGVSPAGIAEQGRIHTQIYPRRVLWADSDAPAGPRRDGLRYQLELVFDYGDLSRDDPYPHDGGDGAAAELTTAGWPVRPDPFSSCRPGFEVRTLRRCRRVLALHHFVELGGRALVRSLDLDYRETGSTGLSLLSSVTVTGHRGGRGTATIPPLTFDYTEYAPERQRFASLTGPELPPVGLADPDTAMIDLLGTGLPGILRTEGNAMRYWRNIGDGRLDRPDLLSAAPAGVALDDPAVALADLGGDGRPDLLVLEQPTGFYEAAAGTPAWQALRHLHAVPTLDLADPSIKQVDLTGDGTPDVLATRADHLLWWECLGERGYAPPRAVRRVHDLARFPDVDFSDPAVRTADLNGDGLSDIVLIHDGRIDYWPGLGHGRFAPRVTMAGAPRLPAGTDPARVFLVDTDGSGCADLVHVGLDEVRIWSNRSGNSWSPPRVVRGTPLAAGDVAVHFADVYGTGTTSIVWSRSAPARPGGGYGAQYHALDLSGGTKPYLLAGVDNGMGAFTRITYGSSARHCAEDARAGAAWATPLAVPVPVVEQVELVERVTGARHVTRYRYHHGYYDGREREFRGFGRVDQFDLEHLNGPALPGLDVSGAAETRTWFHTGIWFDPDVPLPGGGWFGESELTARYRHEFWSGDAAAPSLGAHQVGPGHAAHRALHGAVLRTEVYGRDGGPRDDVPYRVTEQRWRVTDVAPGVHLRTELEAVESLYERNRADPRIQQRLALALDRASGSITDSVTVHYPRRPGPQRLPEQEALHAVYRRLDLATETADPGWHRAGVPVQERTYEIHGLAQPAGLYTAAAFTALIADPDAFLSYDAVPADPDALSAPVKRLVAWTRTYYRRPADPQQREAPAAITLRLPLGQVGPLALGYETLRAAFPASLVTRLFGAARAPGALLEALGYRTEPDAPGWWWEPSARSAYDQGRRYLALGTRDPFGADTRVEYDRYWLLPALTTDRAGNTVRATNDYRALRPRQVVDANGNLAEAAFDAFGDVVVTAIDGDSLDGVETDPDPDAIAAALADPVGGIGGATSRVLLDLHRFRRSGLPVVRHGLVREIHVNQPGGDHSRVHHTAVHQDGFGREAQSSVTADGSRWVISGRTVRDSKGQVVRQFEPSFAPTWEYRDHPSVGVSLTALHDPLGRQVAALHPDHSWEKTVVGAWRQESWDANDTAGIADPATDPDVGGLIAELDPADYRPTWSAARSAGQLGAAEQAAAAATAAHAGTPLTTHFDPLGRAVRAVADNGSDGTYTTRSVLDVLGNPLQILDPAGRAAVKTDYDMLGRALHMVQTDSGERWTLPDAAGRPARTWDVRGHQHRTVHDPAGRLIARYVCPVGAVTERLAERISYGESAPDAQARNLRGRVYQVEDSAGRVVNDRYDVSGNLLASTRYLVADPHLLPDWQSPPALVVETFTVATTYDALGRPLTRTLPDGTVVLPSYTARNELAAVAARLPGAASPTTFVAGADYTARGERNWIDYGNGVRGEYTYDAATHRLTGVSTQRPRGGGALLAIAYTYDPVGNITRRVDGRQPPAFFRNGMADGVATYRYDPVYRLVEATGREHVGQNAAGQPLPPRQEDHVLHPADQQALVRYTEEYRYDSTGNLERVTHTAATGRWVRRYDYAAAGNRLTATSLPGDLEDGPYTARYSHDEHGNMTAMPHLAVLSWDDRDLLRRVDLGGGGTAWYSYDASGQRVRTVIERQNGSVLRERIQLGGYEIQREYSGAGTVTDEFQTVHILDDIRRIALVETRTRRDGQPVTDPVAVVLYQLGDHLGSAQLEIANDGRVVSHEEYYPYGGSSYHVPRGGVEASPKRYGHAGKERDAETSLSYHGARYYVPWLGRWLSADPAGTTDGLNLYSYVRGNPIRLVDPTGTQAADATAPAASTVPAPAQSTRPSAVAAGGRAFVDNVGYFLAGAAQSFKRAGLGIFGAVKWLFWDGIAKILWDITKAERFRDAALSAEHTTCKVERTILDGPDALARESFEGLKAPLDASARALRRGDAEGWLRGSGEAVANIVLLGSAAEGAVPPGGPAMATAEGFVLAGEATAATTPTSLPALGVAMAASTGGSPATQSSASTKGNVGGRTVRFWNTQNRLSNTLVERMTGLVMAGEARLYLQRSSGILERTRRIVDAVGYSLKTGHTALFEWSTRNQYLNSAAKRAQLRLQLEIFTEAQRTGATVWARPANIGIFLDVTRADQYIGTYVSFELPASGG